MSLSVWKLAFLASLLNLKNTIVKNYLNLLELYTMGIYGVAESHSNDKVRLYDLVLNLVLADQSRLVVFYSIFSKKQKLLHDFFPFSSWQSKFLICKKNVLNVSFLLASFIKLFFRSKDWFHFLMGCLFKKTFSVSKFILLFSSVQNLFFCTAGSSYFLFMQLFHNNTMTIQRLFCLHRNVDLWDTHIHT